MLEALIGLLGIIGIVMFMLAYDALAWGWVCYKFWGWFLLPVFPELQQILFWQAVGLMFFFQLLQNKTIQVMKKEYRDDDATNLLIILSPWIVLILGSLVYNFLIPKIV